MQNVLKAGNQNTNINEQLTFKPLIMKENKDIGLLPNDERMKDYILYARGKMGMPQRFYDYILINTTIPYNHASYIKNGFYITDINNIAKQFNGISFDLLGN